MSKEQTEHKLARQKRQRRWFWGLGAILLIIQGIIAVHIARAEPIALALVATSSPITMPQVLVSQPTATRMATPTTTPTPLPTATHTATSIPAPLPTATTPPTNTPPPIKRYTPALARTDALLNTGYGAREVIPTPTKANPALTLLPPPEQVTEQIFKLSGTGQPDKMVSVFYNHSIVAQAKINKWSRWQVNVPTAPLVRGDNTFAVSTSAVSSGHSRTVSFTMTFAPWWLDAPIRLQASLGEGYACAPTVLGMAMDYYHQSDTRYPAPATIELVQALAKKGFVSGYGADAQMVCDLAIAYGYSHSFFYREWSQAHLRQMLDAAHPVIANVRVGLSTDDYGHSVLVIGLSPDGQRVMFNDPARGIVEVSWVQFDHSWASFGPPYRHGTVIKP